jgi:hypothetical protein
LARNTRELKLFDFADSDEADGLLGGGRLPQHVDPASSLGQQMAADAAALASYTVWAFTKRRQTAHANNSATIRTEDKTQ